MSVPETLARYAFALDEPSWPALQQVLTEDVTWTFSSPGAGRFGPVTGPEAVRDFVSTARQGRTDQQRHHLTNVVTHELTRDTAEAEAYLLLTSDSALVTTGRVHLHPAPRRRARLTDRHAFPGHAPRPADLGGGAGRSVRHCPDLVAAQGYRSRSRS